jgi:hypothetical protein
VTWREGLIEAALWLVILALLLVLVRAKVQEPATLRRVECAEWHTLEQRREPDGVVVGSMEHCGRFEYERQ